ncbi:hypothetical protein EXW94_00650, partial [Enterobacter sp. JMULE2]|nr:hypothetical protein [Enterobacter sp. JMULE2]
RAFPGWTQVNSYRVRRSSRAERGVLAYSPAWSELPNRNGGVVIWVRLPPQHVDRMAGTGERKREPPERNHRHL